MMKAYIKQKAKQRGISLQDIAAALELKSYPSFLRTLENADNLKARQLRIIATMLGCTIDELLNASDAVGDGEEAVFVIGRDVKSIKIKIE